MATSPPIYLEYLKIFWDAITMLPTNIENMHNYSSYIDLYDQLVLIQHAWSLSNQPFDENAEKKKIEEIVGEFISKFEKEYKENLDKSNIVPNDTTLKNIELVLGNAIIKIEKIEVKQKVVSGGLFKSSLQKIKTILAPTKQKIGLEPQSHMYLARAQQAKTQATKSNLEINIMTLKKDPKKKNRARKKINRII